MAFRLRKSKGGSTLRGGETIRSIPGDRNLVGSGDASGDALANLGTPVDLAGAGHASGEASGNISGVSRFLAGSGHAAGDASATLGIPVALAGDGQASGDAMAEMGSISFMTSSGHAAGLGLATKLNALITPTVDVSIPAMSSSHDLLGATPQVMVGGLILPSYAPTSSAMSGVRTGLIEPTKYIPQFYDHRRQIVGLEDVGPLLLEPLEIPDTRGPAFEIHFFLVDWMSTPHHDDYYMNTELDVRWVGELQQWKSSQGTAFASKSVASSGNLGQYDGEWVFWLAGSFDGENPIPGRPEVNHHNGVQFAGELVFDWWDTAGNLHEAHSVTVPADGTCRAGVRVNMQVGGGQTTIRFYWATLGANWVLHDTVVFGAEYPIRRKGDQVEIASHNNGDGSNFYWNPPAPMEGTVNSVVMRVDGNPSPVFSMQAGIWEGGASIRPDNDFFFFSHDMRQAETARDSVGRVWTMERVSDHGRLHPFDNEQIECSTHTHTGDYFYHQPFVFSFPHPNDSDFGVGGGC